MNNKKFWVGLIPSICLVIILFVAVVFFVKSALTPNLSEKMAKELAGYSESAFAFTSNGRTFILETRYESLSRNYSVYIVKGDCAIKFSEYSEDIATPDKLRENTQVTFLKAVVNEKQEEQNELFRKYRLIHLLDIWSMGIAYGRPVSISETKEISLDVSIGSQDFKNFSPENKKLIKVEFEKFLSASEDILKSLKAAKEHERIRIEKELQEHNREEQKKASEFLKGCYSK